MPETQETNDNHKESDNKKKWRPRAWFWFLLYGVLVFTGLFIGSWYFKNGAERAKFWVEGLLSAAVLSVVAIQAYIYNQQWKSMQGQLATMQEQANTAKLQAETAADELRRSHRPWLALAEAPTLESPILFGSENKVVVSYKVRNGSNSPALGVAAMQSLAWSFEEAPDIENVKRALALIANPNGLKMISELSGLLVIPQAVQSYPPNPVAIDPATLAEITGKRVTLLFNICVSYRDEFETLHKTCVIYRLVTTKGERSFIAKGAVTGQFESFGLGRAD